MIFSSRCGLDRVAGALGAADMKRADPTLVVGRHGDALQHALNLVVGEALLGETLA